MSEESKNEAREKISAYLDDALSHSELDALSTMISSSRDAASDGQRAELDVSARYQMIGEVLRGQMSDASMIDVRSQVREALLDEKLDVTEAPGNRRVDRKRSIFDLVSLDLSSWFNPAGFNLVGYRSVGGLAVAALVAIILVVTINHEETVFDKGNLVAESNIENRAVSDAINNASIVSLPVSTSVAGAVETRNSAIGLYPQKYSQVNSQIRPRVNLETYLAEHAEFAAQDTMQGRIPYARAVSYEAE